ncbi:unnamed protein product (macronuclear) [Paramecium tetraurelia]|uniref:Uncharacterized protein n=1 Tax=Paramecium tetraurelia TaxID=5888 RepID=A0D1N7_PARTE|nr:uncharacterized protein GSPATT00012478001 [Paramecium tetraurelia]CAK76954.1 unnamed protein product [Paramecium tetraurelia]|eukprot:XP_001444351.1 hypothetical protein (macronuclear) [Paramecium tetraurelia strain d4-2]
MMFALSKYNETLNLQSIVQNQKNNLFSSEQVFEHIISQFLTKLKKSNDRILAIEYLISNFPNNNYFINYKEQLDGKLIGKKWQKFNDHGLQKNFEYFVKRKKLHDVHQSFDWKRLNQLLEDKEFVLACGFPTSLDKRKHIFEKLQHHGFRIIDLMRQCKQKTFQLNSIILKNLIFFFFIPQELEISHLEQQELFQILGEILSQFWIQFEYHYQQLQSLTQNLDNDSSASQLKNLKDLLDFIKQGSNIILQKNHIHSLNLTNIEILIDKLLPIDFDLQHIFYMMCFYCFQKFAQYYSTQLDLQNPNVKFINIKQYLQRIMSPNDQLNQNLMLQLQEYKDRQIQLITQQKICLNQSIKDLLQQITKKNWYELIKKLHVINLNSYTQQNAKFFNLLTNISSEKIYEVAKLLETLIMEDSLIKVVLILEQQKQNFYPQELESILRIVLENSYQSIINFQLLYSVLSQDRSQTEKENILKVAEYDENLPLEQKIQMLSNFSYDQLKLVFNQDVLINTLIESYLQNLTQNHFSLL